MIGRGRACCGVLALVLLAPVEAAAETTCAPARRLVRTMQEAGLDAVALRDPSAPGRVLAAMRFGRTQLTVRVGDATSPRIDALLAAGQHMAVYRQLATQPIPPHGFVLHDLNGLGLRADREPGHAFDMFASGQAPQRSFDGDWETQALTREEYCAAFAQAERAYAHALQMLLGEANAARAARQ